MKPKVFTLRSLLLVLLLAALTVSVVGTAVAQEPEPAAPYGSSGEDKPAEDIPPAPGVESVGSITNGNFETGDLSGWGIYRAGNTTGWSAYSGTVSPQSNLLIAAPPQGIYAATSHQLGPNVQILYQDIFLPGPYNLSFTLYYKNWAEVFFNPPTLDYTGAPNQQYRVDIVDPNAPVTSVAAGDVLANVFQTKMGGPLVLGPTPITFDLSPFVGRTVRLRFAEVDNQLFFNASVDDIRVTPINQPPTADANGPYLVAVGEQITFDGSGSSDPDGDTLTETWTADGGTVNGTLYTAGTVPGIFDVTLTVDDGKGGTDTDDTTVVVYDPSGGFVTGGGWIDSPAGAYVADPELIGKATFGFVSKYKKGANTPTGNTEFQFKAGDLNFHSSSYDWLVVNQGGTNAQFKGSGTINGEGAYKFMLWAGDGEPDTFRIKIWEEDESGVETVIYDNGFDQAIGGGSIVVHTKGK